jgi:hypothetical protein
MATAMRSVSVSGRRGAMRLRDLATTLTPESIRYLPFVRSKFPRACAAVPRSTMRGVAFLLIIRPSGLEPHVALLAEAVGERRSA